MTTRHQGSRFGKYVVLDGYAKPTTGGNYRQIVRVRCDCGAEKEVALSSLKAAKDPMCLICRRKLQSEKAANGFQHPLYKTWWGMIQRCYNPKVPAYKYYGAKGVGVCDAWRGTVEIFGYASIEGFHRFCADMGNRPLGCSLDRINTKGNYEPGNCRWADAHTQANNKSNNLCITVKGVTRTATEWGKLFGVPYWTVAAKMYGVPLNVAATLIADAYPKDRWSWAELFADVATKVPEFVYVKRQPLVESDEEFLAFLKNLGSEIVYP